MGSKKIAKQEVERVKGLISVVIPCKDEESIQPYCLESLRKQTYKDTELIIKEGLHVNVNRNAGFREAKGEFVFFLDSDINLYNDCFEVMKGALDRHPDCSLAYCNYARQGAMKGSHKGINWNPVALKRYNYISTMSLVRSDDFPGFDETIKRFQDWDVWLTMAKHGKKGIFINKILFAAVYDKRGISLRGKADSASSARIIWNKHGIRR